MKVMLTMDGKGFSGEVVEVPQVYDIQTDTRRAVTQADVDKWLEMAASFSKILMAVRDFKGG